MRRRKSRGSSKNGQKKKISNNSPRDCKRSWDDFINCEADCMHSAEKHVKTRRISDILSEGPKSYQVQPNYKPQLLSTVSRYLEVEQVLVETVADSVETVRHEALDLNQELQEHAFGHNMSSACDIDMDEENAVSQLLCPENDNTWDSDLDLELSQCEHVVPENSQDQEMQPDFDAKQQAGTPSVSGEFKNNENTATPAPGECKSGNSQNPNGVSDGSDEKMGEVTHPGINNGEQTGVEIATTEGLPSLCEVAESDGDLGKELSPSDPAPQAQPEDEKSIDNEQEEVTRQASETATLKGAGSETRQDLGEVLGSPASELPNQVVPTSLGTPLKSVEENNLEDNGNSQGSATTSSSSSISLGTVPACPPRRINPVPRKGKPTFRKKTDMSSKIPNAAPAPTLSRLKGTRDQEQTQAPPANNRAHNETIDLTQVDEAEAPAERQTTESTLDKQTQELQNELQTKIRLRDRLLSGCMRPAGLHLQPRINKLYELILARGGRIPSSLPQHPILPDSPPYPEPAKATIPLTMAPETPRVSHIQRRSCFKTRGRKCRGGLCPDDDGFGEIGFRTNCGHPTNISVHVDAHHEPSLDQANLATSENSGNNWPRRDCRQNCTSQRKRKWTHHLEQVQSCARKGQMRTSSPRPHVPPWSTPRPCTDCEIQRDSKWRIKNGNERLLSLSELQGMHHKGWLRPSSILIHPQLGEVTLQQVYDQQHTRKPPDSVIKASDAPCLRLRGNPTNGGTPACQTTCNTIAEGRPNSRVLAEKEHPEGGNDSPLYNAAVPTRFTRCEPSVHTAHARLVSSSTNPCSVHPGTPENTTGKQTVEKITAPELEGCRTIGLPAKTSNQDQKSSAQLSAKPACSTPCSSKVLKLQPGTWPERAKESLAKNNQQPVPGPSLVNAARVGPQSHPAQDKPRFVLQPHPNPAALDSGAYDSNRRPHGTLKLKPMSRGVGMGSSPIDPDQRTGHHQAEQASPNTLVQVRNPRVGPHDNRPLIHQHPAVAQRPQAGGIPVAWNPQNAPVGMHRAMYPQHVGMPAQVQTNMAAPLIHPNMWQRPQLGGHLMNPQVESPAAAPQYGIGIVSIQYDLTRGIPYHAQMLRPPRPPPGHPNTRQGPPGSKRPSP